MHRFVDIRRKQNLLKELLIDETLVIHCQNQACLSHNFSPSIFLPYQLRGKIEDLLGHFRGHFSSTTHQPGRSPLTIITRVSKNAVHFGATVAITTRHRRLRAGNPGVVVVPIRGNDHGLDDGFGEKISPFAGVCERTGDFRAARVVFTEIMDDIME